MNEFTVIRKKFRCPYCSFSAMHQCILKRHMRSHTGERPYPCEICGKKFTRREHMKRHTLVSGRRAAWGRHVASGGSAWVSMGSSWGQRVVSTGSVQGTLCMGLRCPGRMGPWAVQDATGSPEVGSARQWERPGQRGGTPSPHPS